MAYTEQTEIQPQSFFEKMKNSFKGVLLGLILIPASFIIVYYASQREQASEVLNKALPLDQVSKAKEKNLPIYIEGSLNVENVGDDFYLKPGPYLKISRNTQMYAYISEEKSETVKENGKDIKKTTYSCNMGWTSTPNTSHKGKGCESENKTNPPQKISQFNKTTNPNIIYSNKNFSINGEVDYINMPEKNITKEDLSENLPNEKNYFYLSESCKNNPTVGCERFYYSIITYNPDKTYTGIGTVVDQNLSGFVSKENHKYLVIGEGKYNDVIKSLGSRDATMTWILFAISVFALGFGLILLIGPFLELLQMIPFIGNLGSGLIKILLFVVSFVIMGIAFLLIEYWYIVILLVLALLVTLFYLSRKKQPA